MSIRKELKKFIDFFSCFMNEPRLSFRILGKLPLLVRGLRYALNFPSNSPVMDTGRKMRGTPNPLEVFFDSHQSGRGIWKWRHYFDMYHRHLSKFVGQEVSVLEIGIYSGGSLEMWHDYFGAGCRIYGVDIQDATKCYENEYTKVFIGDQESRGFWQSFAHDAGDMDVLVDDGGHSQEQQIVTFEEMLPRLRPGGIYICEDIHELHNGFAVYMQGFIKDINTMQSDPAGQGVKPSTMQECIKSIHFYPYAVVIEKTDVPVTTFIAPKHGTEWQPFKT